MAQALAPKDRVLLGTPSDVARLLGKSPSTTSRVLRQLMGGVVDGRQYVGTVTGYAHRPGEPWQRPYRAIVPLGRDEHGQVVEVPDRDPDQPFRQGELIGFRLREANPGRPRPAGTNRSHWGPEKLFATVTLEIVDKGQYRRRYASRTAGRQPPESVAHNRSALSAKPGPLTTDNNGTDASVGTVHVSFTPALTVAPGSPDLHGGAAGPDGDGSTRPTLGRFAPSLGAGFARSAGSSAKPRLFVRSRIAGTAEQAVKQAALSVVNFSLTAHGFALTEDKDGREFLFTGGDTLLADAHANHLPTIVADLLRQRITPNRIVTALEPLLELRAARRDRGLLPDPISALDLTLSLTATAHHAPDGPAAGALARAFHHAHITADDATT